MTQAVQHRLFFGFLHKAVDEAIRVHLHDAQRAGVLAHDRDGSHGDLGAGILVLLQDLAKIHPVQLVAAQDQDVLRRVGQEVHQVLANRVRRSVPPRRIREGLLGGQNLDKAPRERIELVRARNVLVHGGRLELGQHVDVAQVRVDAVGDRDVHQAVLACQRNRGLGPILGQREQPRPRAPAQDHAEHFLRVDRHAAKRPTLFQDLARFWVARGHRRPRPRN
jgi:hypothetical protein